MQLPLCDKIICYEKIMQCDVIFASFLHELKVLENLPPTEIVLKQVACKTILHYPHPHHLLSLFYC